VENKVMQVLQAVMENQVNVVMLENLALTVTVDSKDRQVQLANKVIEVNPVLYIPGKLVYQDSLVNVEIKVKKETVVLLQNKKLFLLVLLEKKVNREKMVQLVIWVTKVNLVIAANLVNQAALENQTTKALLVKRVKSAKLD